MIVSFRDPGTEDLMTKTVLCDHYRIYTHKTLLRLYSYYYISYFILLFTNITKSSKLLTFSKAPKHEGQEHTDVGTKDQRKLEIPDCVAGGWREDAE